MQIQAVASGSVARIVVVGLALAMMVLPLGGEGNVVAAPVVLDSAPQAAWPGPDAAGYQGCLPGYCWQELATTGIKIPGMGDESVYTLNTGFNFPYYGQTFTQVTVDSNGEIWMGVRGSAWYVNECPMPMGMTGTDFHVALYWNDITMAAGAVYYQNFNPCPIPQGTTRQCLAIEYSNASYYATPIVPGSAGTWEIFFYENGDIIMQYQYLGNYPGPDTTTGIDGDYSVNPNWGFTYRCGNGGGALSPEMGLEFYPSTSSCATIVACPTAVKLISFTAAPGADGVQVRWETASERDNVGFNLYRGVAPDIPGDRLNQSLIPSASPGGGQGATYEVLDDTAQVGRPYEYALESVDISGRRMIEGTVALQLWRWYLPVVAVGGR